MLWSAFKLNNSYPMIMLYKLCYVVCVCYRLNELISFVAVPESIPEHEDLRKSSKLDWSFLDTL